MLPALLLELPFWIRLAWVALVLANLGREWAAHCRAGGERPLRIHAREGSWQLEFDQHWESPRLAGWFAHPRLCVLRFSCPRRVVVLPVDGLSSEQHRRLRVLLRTGGG